MEMKTHLLAGIWCYLSLSGDIGELGVFPALVSVGSLSPHSNHWVLTMLDLSGHLHHTKGHPAFLS